MTDKFVASDVAQNGLPAREGPRKKVIIVGAGMAGLVAAYELLKQGHEKDIAAPEGRIHIAGEHASLEHAWIQGAIESGLRAAWEVNEA